MRFSIGIPAYESEYTLERALNSVAAQNFNDIEIYNNKKGSPKIKISQKIQDILKKKFKLKNYDIHLSLSDEKNHSIAFVILNRKK